MFYVEGYMKSYSSILLSLLSAGQNYRPTYEIAMQVKMLTKYSN